MKILAVIISYVFHPLLMATYGCITVFFGLSHSMYDLFTPLRLKWVLVFTIFAFTFLLPVLNLFILYKLNYISSLKIENRHERTFPLLMTSLCYFGLFYMVYDFFYMVYDFNVWAPLKLFILGGGISILVNALINLWWKISAHMIGIGGLVGVLITISYYVQIPVFVPISVAIFMAGIIGFSRLVLQAHTPAQVYVGFMVGFTTQLSLFFLLQSLTFV